MSYINSTLFFEPIQTKTKNGEKRIMFKARSKSGGAKAELFAIKLNNLTAREEGTLMRYFKKISFSASVHIKRKTSKTYSSKKYSGSRNPKPRFSSKSSDKHIVGELIPLQYFKTHYDAYTYNRHGDGTRKRFVKGDDLRKKKNLLKLIPPQ